jgi:hypothetical protein
MKLFSQRKGIRPLEKSIQKESIGDELKNKLWSALTIVVWDKWSDDEFNYYKRDGSEKVDILIKRIWLYYLNWPIDTIPHFSRGRPKSAYMILRDYFFGAEWWQVYDFIEFILKNIPEDWNKFLKQLVNDFLRIENAAYRIVDDDIVEITDETEIEAVELAIQDTTSIIKTHLQKAIDYLFDKESPDYRNSIKESISAVEAVCQSISGKPGSTLGDCLKALRDKKPLHPAFEQALFKLYGYTSDADGIRHALTEDANPPAFSDAKFMLVSCSSFVNYLITKAAELGIKLHEIK